MVRLTPTSCAPSTAPAAPCCIARAPIRPRSRPSDLPAFLKGTLDPQTAIAVDATPHMLKVLEALKIDALVAIGGDDTLSYAARLHREGFAVMAAPKTMDNDVFGTDYCMGFSTAVSRSLESINALAHPRRQP